MWPARPKTWSAGGDEGGPARAFAFGVAGQAERYPVSHAGVTVQRCYLWTPAFAGVTGDGSPAGASFMLRGTSSAASQAGGAQRCYLWTAAFAQWH